MTALSSNESLTYLQLGQNALGDNGLKILCPALRRPGCKLRRLHLDSNGLTESCTDDLVSTLGTKCSLTELDLSNNKLCDGGLRRLSAALQTEDCQLQALHLANNDLTGACADDLSSILTSGESLISIVLDGNKLGDLGVLSLCSALRNAEFKIQTLGLAANGLTDTAAKALASGLSGNRTLVSLDLQANAFTDRAVSPLQAFVKACASLQEIRLMGNRFTGDGKDELELLNGWRPRLKVDVRLSRPRT